MLPFKRQLQISIGEQAGVFVVSCSLEDPLHNLILTHKVSLENPMILSGELQVKKAPNPECQQLILLPEKLVGISLDKGFTKKVIERLGGSLGCVNLVNMVLVSLPLVINTSWFYYASTGQYSPEEIKNIEKGQMAGVCLGYPIKTPAKNIKKE